MNFTEREMGRTIVITGAGDGLGRALARRFARDGETVILLGRTLAKVEAVAAELGAPHFALACDIADPDQVRKAFATIAGRFAHIDALINNAGVFMPFTLAEATDHQVRDLIDINIAGTVLCSSLLDKIALLLQAAHSEIHRDLKALCNEVSREASVLDVTTGAGPFILFRLLVMMPWSARAAEGDLSLYAAAVIGALFDGSGMPNRFLRPLADTWGHWSIRWCWRLGNAWRAACRLHNVPVGL